MKLQGNAIRPGNLIEHKGRLWVAVRTQHVQPGKGGAYMQVELKDVRDGTKLNERFRASETVERARIDEKKYQYLYGDDDLLTLMDPESYEQISVERRLLGDSAVFLKDGMDLTVGSYEDKPISARLPDTTTATVVETEPVVKGQTAAASFKPAVLDNGVRLMVPPHIEVDTKVVVNVEDRTYVERAKD
jgi:elongation factor P